MTMHGTETTPSLFPLHCNQFLLIVNINPIKKGRQAQFLKEYWGIGHGGSREQNTPLKSLVDVGSMIGESKFSTKRLLKLNSLIPVIQDLVESDEIKPTVAYKVISKLSKVSPSVTN